MQFGNCLDRIIGVIAPAAVAAVAIAERGFELLTLAEPTSALIVGSVQLAMHLAKQNRNECAAALKRVRNKLEAELERDFAARGMDAAFMADAFAEIDGVLPDARPSTDELVHQWRLDPVRVAEGMVEKMSASSRMIRNDPRVRAVAVEMVARTVAEIKDCPELFAKLQPAVARQILADLALLPKMDAKLDVLVAESSTHSRQLDSIERQLAVLATIIAGNAARVAPNAEAANMMAISGVEVARHLTEGTADLPGHSAIRSAIDDISELAKAGRLEQAADRANQAVSESESRRLSAEDCVELLQRAMDVDLLRFDYDSVAARLKAMIAVDMPTASEEKRFAALLDRQRSWHTRDILESALSGKAYVALHVALAIARRAEEPLQVMQSTVAAVRSASALGERLKDSWFGGSIPRSVVRNVRTRAMAQLMQAFGQQNPVSAQFIDAILSYGQQTRDRATGDRHIAASGLDRWELACFAFPLIDDGVWSRLPAGLLGVVRLIVAKAFTDAANKAALPAGFKVFLSSAPEAETILNREYLGGPAVARDIGMPTGALFEAAASHYASGIAVSASADDLLQTAAAVAVDDRSRAAAEVHEWAGRRAFERFWNSGDISDLNATDVSIDRAASTFDPKHDHAKIAELTGLRAEVRQILRAQV